MKGQFNNAGKRRKKNEGKCKACINDATVLLEIKTETQTFKLSKWHLL